MYRMVTRYRGEKPTGYWTRVGARRRKRAIACYWDKTPRMRKVAIRSKCGLSDFGIWYYNCLFAK